MWAYFERLLDSSMLSPHGNCLLWEPELIWLHVVSDALIAAAYFSIPFALTILVTKRRDLKFGWLYWAFAVFIMACGLTHVLSIYTLWVPIYGIEGIGQGGDGGCVRLHRRRALAAVAEDPDDPSPFELRQVQAALEEEEIKSRDATLLLQQVGDAQRALRESMDAPHRRRRDRGRRRHPVRRAGPHSPVQSGLRALVRLSRRRGHEPRTSAC